MVPAARIFVRAQGGYLHDFDVSGGTGCEKRDGRPGVKRFKRLLSMFAQYSHRVDHHVDSDDTRFPYFNIEIASKVCGDIACMVQFLRRRRFHGGYNIVPGISQRHCQVAANESRGAGNQNIGHTSRSSLNVGRKKPGDGF
jgi:hypothetical protein